MPYNSYPRIVISGLSGDSGKTIVSCGLLAYYKSKGWDVLGFKKGPDYIDSAWLRLASDKPARNLDTFMMGFPTVKKTFLKYAGKFSLNIIEGNRGLFDGVDVKGKHSTAELARLLEAPVIIVQNITKVTRTAAASILGCIGLDPGLNIQGVILNNVAGKRHVSIAKDAIERETGIPVIGVIPKLPEKYKLPSRHLGLIMPDEFQNNSTIIHDLSKIIEDNVDVSKILEISQNVPSLHYNESETDDILSIPEIQNPKNKKDAPVKIGYFHDNSFSFYYPENLEMLTQAGAYVIAIDPSHDHSLDDLDALYIGGGFPEMNLPDLASHTALMETLKKKVESGFPIYAECGGLMYLAKKIKWGNKEYPLTGILPIKIQMHAKPRGHGYCKAFIDKENPFFKKGVLIKGHEFHYSEIFDYDPDISTCMSVTRGKGSFNGRDGLTYKNVFASYIHVHALSTPEWVGGMICSAQKYKNNLKMNIC